MEYELTDKLKENSHYLGDGLYAYYDGYQIRLFSSNGLKVLEHVFLNDEVIARFIDYIEEIKILK